MTSRRFSGRQPGSMSSPWIGAALVLGLAVLAAPVRGQDAPAVEAAVAQIYNEGLEAANNGDFQTAKSKFQAAAQQAPDFVEAHYNLGLVLQNLSEYAGARDSFRKTLALDADNAAAKRLLADSLFQLGDFGGAVNEYGHAIAADSTRFELYYSAADAAGRAYTEPSDLAKVITAYRTALRKDPSNPAAFNAAIAMANTAGRMDDSTTALEAYQRAIKIKPDSPTAHYNCAVILQKLKRHKEAAQQLESAIALKQPYGQAHFALAGIYYNTLKDEEKALAHYEKAAADPAFNKVDKARQYADSIRDYLEKKAAAAAAKEGSN